MNKTEQGMINKHMREIVSGGRDLLRTYARIKEVSVGTAKELRQTSILTAVRMMTKRKKRSAGKVKGIEKNRDTRRNNPNLEILKRIEIDGLGRWEWDSGEC